ncbi:MAG: energy-coupling factor transporter ATPase [Clostridia bacterium]|nr:energy-coupling factor transporter ATPase [Clostridia bacterium]
MSYIVLKGVNFTYSLGEGRSLKALKNLSFSVEKGSFVALVGMNGSGKSTLSKLLNGLFLPTNKQGQVIVDGINTKEVEDGTVKDGDGNEVTAFDVRRKVGIVFQNPDNQTVATIVEDDVAFGPENIGLPREEIVERVTSALESVGMQDYKDRPVSKLSGGQKQRVAIAGVLAMRPDVIVFDESTAMLDPLGRREIMSIAKELNNQGITVIMVTHNMDEAALADRIIVLSKGEVALDGTPKEVFSQDVTRFGLTLPPATETANRLGAVGFDFDGAMINEVELVEGICKQLR